MRRKAAAEAARSHDIAIHLAAQPAFIRAVRAAHDQIRAAYLPVESVVASAAVTPVTRAGLLWIFTRKAEGSQADSLREKARALITPLLDRAGTKLTPEDIIGAGLYAGRRLSALGPVSTDTDHERERAARYIAGLTESDYANLGARAVRGTRRSVMADLAENKESAYSLAAKAGAVPGPEGPVQDRLLVSAIRQYANAIHAKMTESAGRKPVAAPTQQA